jgi:Zn-dependent M32 family carboxypeptidase
MSIELITEITTQAELASVLATRAHLQKLLNDTYDPRVASTSMTRVRDALSDQLNAIERVIENAIGVVCPS